MLYSFLLALVSGLLSHTLPITPNTSLNTMNARRQWTPILPYPAGESAATCPLVPGADPYSTLQVPGPNKRSLSTATPLHRRDDLCKQIAQGTVNNFANEIGNTEEVLLIAGATYVFSWALTEIVRQIRAWRNNHDGTFSVIQSTGYNGGGGSMMLNMDQAADVHFEIQFSDHDPHDPYGFYPVNGEFALFQTANGNQNP